MSQRITIGLSEGASGSKIEKDLRSFGAEHVTSPDESQPVIVATVPDDCDVEAFLERTRKLRGVSYVERDAWQTTM